MKNGKLYLDRSMEQQVHGLYDDARFYSVVYEPASAAEGRAAETFRAAFKTYQRWCKDCYNAIQAGQGTIPFPKELVELVEKPNAKAKTTKAHADTQEG